MNPPAAPEDGRTYSVMEIGSPEAIARLLAVLLPDAATALDATFGQGGFWDGSAHVRVTGLDIDSGRAPHVVGDFRALPFADSAFDVVVFDPPFHTDVSKRKASVMGGRFGHYPTIPTLREAVTQGCREAWRVARLGAIVKCQDYIHQRRAVWMSEWVRRAFPVQPFDQLMTYRPHKIVDPKWSRQLSVWRNHAVFWVYRKDGDIHRARRTRAASSARRRGRRARPSAR